MSHQNLNLKISQSVGLNQNLKQPQLSQNQLNRLGNLNTSVYLEIDDIQLRIFDYNLVVKDIKMSIGVIKRILINRKFDDPTYNCAIYNRVKTLFNIIKHDVMLYILKRELGNKFFYVKKSIILCTQGHNE